MTNYQNIKSAPDDPHIYFLVRPQGIHIQTQKKYLPTIVHMMYGRILTAEGRDVCKNFGPRAKLEWHPLPD